MFEDSLRHQGMRRRLVDEIRGKGISDELVLKAIGEVPRHLFMDQAFIDLAYQDKAFPIEADQTISQPYTVAYQSQLLMAEPGMKVLEIGTGSGYQTSVLCKMGLKVYSIERHKVLFTKVKKLLQELNLTARVFYGDGFKGLPTYGPYDRILVTCAAPSIPVELVRQLVPGGIMVVPLGAGNEQIMNTILKKNGDHFETFQYEKFRFVPMLANKAP